MTKYNMIISGFNNIESLINQIFTISHNTERAKRLFDLILMIFQNESTFKIIWKNW